MRQFDGLREGLERLRLETLRETRRTIAALLEPRPGAQILDCGCGTGEVTADLVSGVRSTDVVAFDLLREHLNTVKRHGIRWVLQADLNEALPFKDRSFDVICASQVIEVTSNPAYFLQELYRLIREQGYLILSTPNLASLHNVYALLAGRLPSTLFDTAAGHPCGLVEQASPRPPWPQRQAFTRGGVVRLLVESGFRIERLVSVGYYPFVGRLARVLARWDATHSVQLVVKALKAVSVESTAPRVR
jgi:2-polyprenyl-3-methyl-5-hydroxy-6-metoxy-1,4-benzoquinol methylase